MLITQYEILEGNPPDEQHVEASLERHKEKFGHAPKLYSADRGFHSERNEKSGQREGVQVVCIPQRGGKKTEERTAYEKSPDFKKGQRFRAGIEGTISVLFRGRGMKRCLAEGSERFEIWVGAAVLANNLMRIADLLDERSLRKTKSSVTVSSEFSSLSPPVADVFLLPCSAFHTIQNSRWLTLSERPGLLKIP